MTSTSSMRSDEGSVTAPSRPTSRRLGYVIGAAVNVALLYVVVVIGVEDLLPFVTDDFGRVSGYVAFSFAAGAVFNVAYLVYDRPWFKSIGQVITSIVGVVTAVRLWQVFPFDFSGYSVDWSIPVRVVLAIAIVGGLIGVVAELVRAVARQSIDTEKTRGGPDGDGGRRAY